MGVVTEQSVSRHKMCLKVSGLISNCKKTKQIGFQSWDFPFLGHYFSGFFPPNFFVSVSYFLSWVFLPLRISQCVFEIRAFLLPLFFLSGVSEVC